MGPLQVAARAARRKTFASSLIQTGIMDHWQSVMMVSSSDRHGARNSLFTSDPDDMNHRDDDQSAKSQVHIFAKSAWICTLKAVLIPDMFA